MSDVKDKRGLLDEGSRTVYNPRPRDPIFGWSNYR